VRLLFVQVFNEQMRIYSNDLPGHRDVSIDGGHLLKVVDRVVTRKHSRLVLGVSNGRVDWRARRSRRQFIESKFLFSLPRGTSAGLYVGMNRVIADDFRAGSGLCRAVVSLFADLGQCSQWRTALSWAKYSRSTPGRGYDYLSQRTAARRKGLQRTATNHNPDPNPLRCVAVCCRTLRSVAVNSHTAREAQASLLIACYFNNRISALINTNDGASRPRRSSTKKLELPNLLEPACRSVCLSLFRVHICYCVCSCIFVAKRFVKPILFCLSAKRWVQVPGNTLRQYRHRVVIASHSLTLWGWRN